MLSYARNSSSVPAWRRYTFRQDDATMQSENKKVYNEFLRSGWERRTNKQRFGQESERGVNMGMNPYRGMKPEAVRPAPPSHKTARDPLMKPQDDAVAARPRCVSGAIGLRARNNVFHTFSAQLARQARAGTVQPQANSRALASSSVQGALETCFGQP